MRSGDYKTSEQAENYHQKRFSGGLSQVHLDEVKQLKSWLPKPTKPLTYLDLGSGTGRIIKFLLEQNPKKVYALDQSAAMINFIKGEFSKQLTSRKLQTIVGDAHKIPLPDNSVDIITAFHLFKHLSDPQPTLEEVSRVLKPGGIFVFDVLNKRSVIIFKLETCFALSMSQISSLTKTSGLRIEKSQFLHPLGETPYSVLGGKLLEFIQIFDQVTRKLGLNLGTKILILAKK